MAPFRSLPAMEKENLSVNLLGDKRKSTLDILLVWALYIGRLLVIITETAALLVFLSRFSIDRQLVDYSDSIKKQQSMVEYFKQSEETYRNAQLKLKVSKTNTASASATVSLFNDIMRKTSSQLAFSSLTVSPTSLTVTAQAASVDTLSSFTEQLKQHPAIAALNINKVGNKAKTNVVTITITAKLKKVK